MKLNQYLAIQGTAVPLNSIKATLTHQTAGRAIVTTRAALPLKGLVTVMLGYADVRQWFTGYVESTETLGHQHHRAILREPAAILANPLPLSLVHPTLRQILDNITALTGVYFHCTDKDGIKQTANLTHAGTGYSLLSQLGVIFGITDYTWFSQPDGSVWLGSWQDCHWASRPIEVSEKLFDGQLAVSGAQLPTLPAVRPDCLINGRRIKQVMFDGSTITLQWYEMQNLQTRELRQLLPELAHRSHLALLGRVTAICEPTAPGHVQSQWRPAFGVDVQLLNADGSDNTAVPEFKNVPLPGATMNGQGQFAYAQVGTLVELGFAFGYTHQPFVRTVLGLGLSLPALENGEYHCQFNDGFHHIDSGGSQTLHTEQHLRLSSQSMETKTDQQQITTGQHNLLTEGHHNDTTLGNRQIEANWLTLLGLSGTRIGTEKTHEVLAGENLLETVGKLRRSVAATHWAGDEGTNIYQLLLQLMAAVEALAAAAASHTHISAMAGQPNQPPLNAAAFTAQQTKSKALQDSLSPLI